MDGSSIVMIVLAIVIALSAAVSFFVQARALNINPDTSIGVKSVLSTLVGDGVGSLFVVHLPISLLWLGILMFIISGQAYFVLPTITAILACVICALVEKLIIGKLYSI